VPETKKSHKSLKSNQIVCQTKRSTNGNPVQSRGSVTCQPGQQF